MSAPPAGGREQVVAVELWRSRRAGSPSGRPPCTRRCWCSRRSPRSSCWSTMSTTRLSPLGLALRQQAEVGDLGAGEQHAEPFGQAATQAPQPMQAAASNAPSASALGTGIGVRLGRAAGRRGDVAAGLDDPVERAAVDDQVLDHRERRGPPRLDVDRLAVVEVPHVQLAGGGGLLRAVRHAVDHHAARCRRCPRGSRGRTRPAPRRRAISCSLRTSSISRNDMSGVDVVDARS